MCYFSIFQQRTELQLELKVCVCVCVLGVLGMHLNMNAFLCILNRYRATTLYTPSRPPTVIYHPLSPLNENLTYKSF